jgi:hypothetical protein
LEDWDRIFVGFNFLRIISYTLLWFIGKGMKTSIGLLSYASSLQEYNDEVGLLGKNPGAKRTPYRAMLALLSTVAMQLATTLGPTHPNPNQPEKIGSP